MTKQGACPGSCDKREIKNRLSTNTEAYHWEWRQGGPPTCALAFNDLSGGIAVNQVEGGTKKEKKRSSTQHWGKIDI